MIRLTLYHFAILTILTVFVWMYGPQYAALSFFIGGYLIGLVLILWAIGMTLIIQKKFVAPAIFVIVFKYAISGIIIYWVVRKAWLQPLWLALGVSTLVLSALLYAFLTAIKEGKSNGI